MSLYKMFPRALGACFVFCLLSASAAAQTATRPQKLLTPVDDHQYVQAGPEKISLPASTFKRPTAIVRERVPVTPSPAATPPARIGQLNQTLMSAIGGRLGAPYRMGATGPNRYDCSGFVWSVFQDAGVTFERGSARTLWQRLVPPAEDDKFKFGTLVFFNHLNHVGIVADENGFYHASSSRGVTYSPFNEYWTKRINGFRRVSPVPPSAPLANALAAAAATGK